MELEEPVRPRYAVPKMSEWRKSSRASPRRLWESIPWRCKSSLGHQIKMGVNAEGAGVPRKDPATSATLVTSTNARVAKKLEYAADSKSVEA